MGRRPFLVLYVFFTAAGGAGGFLLSYILDLHGFLTLEKLDHPASLPVQHLTTIAYVAITAASMFLAYLASDAMCHTIRANLEKSGIGRVPPQPNPPCIPAPPPHD